VILSVVPRPLSRAEFVLGKWLGLAALLVVFATVFAAVETAAIALATGYHVPHGFAALAYLIAQALVMLSLALALGTRLAALASGLLAVLAFGIGWISGITAGIAAALHNEGVLHAATIAGLLIPSDGLWRGALFELEPVVLLAATNAGAGPPNPFGVSAPPPAAFIVWSAAWVILALTFAIGSFARRDL
jgi:ABC-type transport system involved in multi-copper enzyme maturation permease subunit